MADLDLMKYISQKDVLDSGISFKLFNAPLVLY